MDHFPIIQALCRVALTSENTAVRRQVERLRDALLSEGADREAKSLSSLLSTAERTAQMTPSRLVRSETAMAGEALTARTIVPVDKETANPLAEILLPDQLPNRSPIFDRVSASAVQSLLDEWQRSEALEAVGIAPTRSCLIYGAPGTGKTQLALWIGRELQLPVVLARLDGLISSFLGTTARNISALFGFANRYRSLLLLDEFDAIAKLRDDPQEVGEIKRVVNAVLQNLDARRPVGLTIGITNHEALLDRAIWRRFESQIAVPRPNFEARLAIARSYAMASPADESTLRVLAWLTDGATGAEIETLVKSLAKQSILYDGLRRAPIDAIVQLLSLHGGRIRTDRQEILQLGAEETAKVLLDDPDLGFGQSDVATLFDRDKATVSRWLKHSRQTRASS